MQTERLYPLNTAPDAIRSTYTRLWVTCYLLEWAREHTPDNEVRIHEYLTRRAALRAFLTVVFVMHAEETDTSWVKFTRDSVYDGFGYSDYATTDHQYGVYKIGCYDPETDRLTYKWDVVHITGEGRQASGIIIAIVKRLREARAVIAAHSSPPLDAHIEAAAHYLPDATTR